MGTQRPVVIGEEPIEDLGGPISEHHGKNKSKVKSQKSKIEKQIKEKKFEKDKTAEGVKEPEVGEKTSENPEQPETQSEKKSKKVKVGKAKVRSKKYKEALAFIDRKKIYDFESAVELVQKTSLSRFDGNVELHIKLASKTGKPESVRGTLKYPHETGKKINVIILDEVKIAEIEKTKKIDFDIAISSPEMMPNVAKLAKILGPKGKMPNPKSGTVSVDPEKTKKELEGGLTEYKTDSYGIIHQVIGKVSSEPKNLEENFRALMTVLPHDKIKSAYMCATIGPALKVLTR